ncbi:uncharacterized protein CXorf65 homolog [Rhynchonycteris naso]
MFIYIKHGDNEEFLVNTNCAVHRMLNYIRQKVGLPEKDTIDLCDEAGTMKLFFLMKKPGDYAIKFLTPRDTYYVCKVARGAPGSRLAHAYLGFVPILKNPDHTLLEALHTQCDTMEKNRLRLLKLREAKKVKIKTPAHPSSKTSKDKPTRKSAFHKAREGFASRRGRPRPTK